MLQVIYIADRSFFHIGGHAYAGYFPANECMAYLYYIDTTDYTIPVDTVSLDTLGYYYFWQVPTGDYYVKVQPKKTSEWYGKMLPTYYGDVPYWEDATRIDHTETNWGYHINFIEAIGMDSGDGNISGNVMYIEISGGTDYDLPAKGIDIHVLNENNESLVSHYSDHNGMFEFPQVAMGIYKLLPEVAGLNPKIITVEVTLEVPDVDTIEIFLTPGEIDWIEYDEVDSENLLGLPYPNPSTEQVNLTLSSETYGEAKIELFDLQGRLLQTRRFNVQSGENTLHIKTNSMKSGIYFVRATLTGNISERRFIVGN